MRNHLVCIALIIAVGCVPSAKTSVEHARAAQAKCQGVSNASVEPVLAQSMVDSVEPAYTYAIGGPNGRIARLAGAQIHMLPIEGTSRQWVERALECHEARVTLGQVCAADGDPYRPASGWVNIDVESDRDGYVVRLTSDDVDDAHAILDRARSFATRRN